MNQNYLTMKMKMKMNRTVTLMATVLMVLISLIGCKSRPEPTVTVTESTTVRNEVRDTTVLVESDTAWLTLYVDCPPERVSERSAERGTRSSIEWKAKRTGSGSTIEIECKSDSHPRGREGRQIPERYADAARALSGKGV